MVKLTRNRIVAKLFFVTRIAVNDIVFFTIVKIKKIRFYKKKGRDKLFSTQLYLTQRRYLG